MLIFLATWAEIINSPKINKFPSTEEITTCFIDCLACPKGVKYKRISNQQAVPTVSYMELGKPNLLMMVRF